MWECLASFFGPCCTPPATLRRVIKITCLEQSKAGLIKYHYDNDWGFKICCDNICLLAPTQTTWSCLPLPILCFAPLLPSVSCWPAAESLVTQGDVELLHCALGEDLERLAGLPCKQMLVERTTNESCHISHCDMIHTSLLLARRMWFE